MRMTKVCLMWSYFVSYILVIANVVMKCIETRQMSNASIASYPVENIADMLTCAKSDLRKASVKKGDHL